MSIFSHTLSCHCLFKQNLKCSTAVQFPPSPHQLEWFRNFLEIKIVNNCHKKVNNISIFLLASYIIPINFSRTYSSFIIDFLFYFLFYLELVYCSLLPRPKSWISVYSTLLTRTKSWISVYSSLLPRTKSWISVYSSPLPRTKSWISVLFSPASDQVMRGGIWLKLKPFGD